MSDAFAIRRLVVADAFKLKACFQRCYGDSYVADYFYDPARLRARITSGRLRSVVAVTDAGDIVGHMGLTLRHPDARTVDAGNTIVDPDHRGQQLVMQLGLAINVLCIQEGFLGYHHYPTTVHSIMQKLSVADAGVETGVMLAYIPSGTEYREFDGEPFSERPAVTVVFRPFAPCPARTVYLPADYADTIAEAYIRADLHRTRGVPDANFDARDTILTPHDDRRRGLLRLDVRHPGEGLVQAIEAAADNSEAEVVQVDLPLGAPTTPVAAEALRANGFLFCAVLPEYLDGDVLRLQRLRDRSLPTPTLVNPDAQAIFALIQRDYRRGTEGRECQT